MTTPNATAAKFTTLISRLALEDKLFHLDDEPSEILKGGTDLPLFTADECKEINKTIRAFLKFHSEDAMWDIFSEISDKVQAANEANEQLAPLKWIVYQGGDTVRTTSWLGHWVDVNGNQVDDAVNGHTKAECKQYLMLDLPTFGLNMGEA